MKSSKNYLIALFVLTTLAGGALAYRQYQELVALRASAMSNDERADWQKRLWAAEKQRNSLEAALAEKHHDADFPPAGEEGPRGERGFRRGGPNAFTALMEHPEIQKLMAVQQKGALDARYAGLFKNLHLTPEQLEKFKNLLVEKQTSMMDVLAAARAQGINPRSDPDAFRKLVGDAQAELDSNIKATIGDAAYGQYKDYENTLPQRTTVNQLEQRLSYSQTPLSDTQAEQLVQVLANNSPTRPAQDSVRNNVLAAMGPGVQATFGTGTRITDAALNQAAGVLTGPQIDALKDIQTEQQAQAKVAQAIRQQFNGQQNQAATPTAGATTPATPMGGNGGG